MSEPHDALASLTLELRRGTIVLCVLSQLENPKYGYSLVQSLEVKGINVDPNTLYPLLRRLEKQEILKSEWETSGTKPRKYYCLTDFGRNIYQKLCRQWNEISKCMKNLIEGNEKNV